MFRDFDPRGRGDVPDPYFGGDDGFSHVLALVERTSAALVEELGPLLRTRAAEAH
jgi:protein-tyrosine phosphatase